MMAPMVAVDRLTKRFSSSSPPALNGVVASLSTGCITGLVGPDGAGKTTLLRLIMGLLKPDEGTVTVDGLDSLRDAQAIREFAGYMPQRFGLYEDLTVQENLNLYADLRGLSPADRNGQIARLLEFTDLGAFTGRLAGRLSGGMKQKLGLACALLKTPRLLLLDEPSVGVDPGARRELWRMVGDLVKEGMTVVWSTAYLDEAERCDDVLLLNAGVLLFAGRPAELTAQVDGRSYHLRGIQSNRRTVLARALQREEVIDGLIQGRSVRLVFRKPGDADTLAFRSFVSNLDAGPDIRVRQVAPNFEDAFVDLLGGGPGGRSALAEGMEPAEQGDGPAIEASGLVKKFGSFTAVENLSFSVKRGEVFGLLGPNGAGKSTTFRMLCGLLAPTMGNARIAGLDLATAPSAARRRLGYMAQSFSLYGNLSTQQNLAFFAGAYGLSGRGRRERMERMIEVFGLAPYLDMSADSLPLGFKKRLALSCAVMHAPAVLFLDEPTSGVDPITRREFWTHINGMVEKGMTVMVTTHFMDEAENCDRISLIYRGREIATGSPDDLKDRVRNPHLPDPTLEDTFIALVAGSDMEARAAR